MKKTCAINTGLSHRRIAQQKEICQSLITYFETERPYLDSALSLRGVARELGINTNYLSLAIKQVSGGGFYAFVNNYRVNYAISLIREHQGLMSSKTLCYASGFKSSSTFHDNFHRCTGVSPGQYTAF